MKNRKTNLWDNTLVALFLLCSLLYIFYNYTYTFIFLSQYHLFLDTSLFFQDRLGEPGGLAEYVTSWLMGFVTSPGSVCLLITSLVGVAFFLFRYLLKRSGSNNTLIQSALPCCFYLYIFPESLYPLLILIFALVISIGYTFVSHLYSRLLWALAGMLISYYLAAPAYFLVMTLCICTEFHFTKQKRTLYTLSTLFFLWSLLLPLLTMRFFIVMPLREAFLSKYISHPEYPFPISLLLVGLLYPSFLLFSNVLNRIKVQIYYLLSFVILFLFWGMIFIFKHNSMEQTYRYDYLVYNKDWHTILKIAKDDGLKNQQDLVYLNLALSATGQLGERFFAFPQTGVESLIPQDPKSRLELIQASEVAWHLGHIQAAQRFAFVGVLSAERSVQPRLMQRLIDTYLVQSEYRAAEKYIKILEASPLYSTWASSRRLLLDQAVSDTTSWIIEKRKQLPVTDNAYDLTRSFPNAIAFLIDDHPMETNALHYGLNFLLLYKNYTAFIKYIESRKPELKALPVHYQEALCYYYTVIDKNQEAFNTYPIETKVTDRYLRFMQSAGKLPEAILREQFGDTYYYYAHFVQPPIYTEQ